MLDFNVTLEFKPELAIQHNSKIDQLIISSCALHYCETDNRILSDFDDLCYNELNFCERGLGFLDIEIGFSGYTGMPYPKAYSKCFRLFTNNWLLIKPMKLKNNASESKVNQRGETVIGFRYYFQRKEELEQLESAQKLMFDSFFALGKPTNTYALACQCRKENDHWVADYANTYHTKEWKNIEYLID